MSGALQELKAEVGGVTAGGGTDHPPAGAASEIWLPPYT